MVFSPGHLTDGEQIQRQMECCHISQLLLKAEEGCFRNSVKARSKKVPCLIPVNSLLCPASIQQYNEISFKPEPFL
jgi:hypothetical protein